MHNHFNPVFGSPGHGSTPNADLGAALMVFALVGLIFGAIFLYPLIRNSEENEEADRQEAAQAQQRAEARQDTMRMEFLSQASEHARQNDPTEKWIHGR